MIRAATREEILWVTSKLPIPPTSNSKGVLNYVDEEIGAAVIYDGWTPNSVQVHVYSAKPARLFSHEFIHEIFWYPFVQCNRELLYSVTPADAEASLGVSKALGFRETYRMKDGWEPGVDLVLKEMRRDDCKYLRMN